jgi:hypothetical protein
LWRVRQARTWVGWKHGAQRALGATILLGCVWTCESKINAVGNKNGVSGMVVEFFAIVGLNAHDGALKLRVNESMKSNQSR